MQTRNNYRDVLMQTRNNYRDVLMQTGNNYRDVLTQTGNNYRGVLMQTGNNYRDVLMQTRNNYCAWSSGVEMRLGGGDRGRGWTNAPNRLFMKEVGLFLSFFRRIYSV